MFAKLLKYEWKSNAKLLGILSAAAVLLGILGTVVSDIAFSLIYNAFVFEDDAIEITFGLSLLFVLLFILLSIAAYSVSVQFVLAYRFYKNKYTDEGYLTFTLPVTSKDIFMSSAVNMTIWFSISAVIGFVSMVGIFGAMFYNIRFFNDIDDIIELMFHSLTVTESALLIVQIASILVSSAASLLVSVVSIITSITIGSVIVKKHKILTSVGIYFAINFGMSIVTSIVTSVPEIIGMFLINNTAMMVCQSIAVLFQVILYGILCVVGYKVCINLMDNKLNLP